MLRSYLDYHELNESLDTVLPFYATEDSKLPNNVNLAITSGDHHYIVTFAKANAKGLYIVNLGLMMNKNLKYWKFASPSDLRPVLATLMKIIEATVPFLPQMEGLAIRVNPATKNYLPLAQALLKRSYLKNQFVTLPVNNVKKDPRQKWAEQYIFLGRKGKNYLEIFKHATFAGYPLADILKKGVSIVKNEPPKVTITVHPGTAEDLASPKEIVKGILTNGIPVEVLHEIKPIVPTKTVFSTKPSTKVKVFGGAVEFDLKDKMVKNLDHEFLLANTIIDMQSSEEEQKKEEVYAKALEDHAKAMDKYNADKEEALKLFNQKAADYEGVKYIPGNISQLSKKVMLPNKYNTSEKYKVGFLEVYFHKLFKLIATNPNYAHLDPSNVYQNSDLVNLYDKAYSIASSGSGWGPHNVPFTPAKSHKVTDALVDIKTALARGIWYKKAYLQFKSIYVKTSDTQQKPQEDTSPNGIVKSIYMKHAGGSVTNSSVDMMRLIAAYYKPLFDTLFKKGNQSMSKDYFNLQTLKTNYNLNYAPNAEKLQLSHEMFAFISSFINKFYEMGTNIAFGLFDGAYNIYKDKYHKNDDATTTAPKPVFNYNVPAPTAPQPPTLKYAKHEKLEEFKPESFLDGPALDIYKSATANGADPTFHQGWDYLPLKKELNKEYDWHSLVPSEIDSLFKAYTGSYNNTINGIFRSIGNQIKKGQPISLNTISNDVGSYNISKNTINALKMIKVFDHLKPCPIDLVLFRGGFIPDNKDWNLNEYYVEPGFSSTSMATGFGGQNARFCFIVPKGSPIVPVYKTSGHSEEEVLLPPFSVCKVVEKAVVNESYGVTKQYLTCVYIGTAMDDIAGRIKALGLTEEHKRALAKLLEYLEMNEEEKKPEDRFNPTVDVEFSKTMTKMIKDGKITLTRKPTVLDKKAKKG